jgi:hypothetical protein
MKQGQENALTLYKEIKRQADTKKDYLAPTNKLKMFPFSVMNSANDYKEVQKVNLIVGTGTNEEQFSIRDTAHDHIALHTGIHKKYYDKMLSESPELLATNVNHWFNKNPDNRMVRTLDGSVRAMLSPRYRILDNLDLSHVIFSEMQEYNDRLILASSQITERRLYMKFVFPEMRAVVRVGDIVRGGVIISNSEIGYGRISISPFLDFLSCTNGMISSKQGLKKNHVGRQLDEFDEAQQYFVDETRKADDRAFYLKVRDVFRGTLSGDIFNAQVELLKDAATKEITGNIEGAVQTVANKYLFTEDERSSVLQHLIRVSDYTKYGMANAVTRAAQDLESYDRATHFEKIGGEVIVLPQNEWSSIATAGVPEEKKRRGRKPSHSAVESVYV